MLGEPCEAEEDVEYGWLEIRRAAGAAGFLCRHVLEQRGALTMSRSSSLLPACLASDELAMLVMAASGGDGSERERGRERARWMHLKNRCVPKEPSRKSGGQVY